MHFSPDGKFIRTDIWREGEYLDLWSVPHFLSGIALGLASHLVAFDTIPTLIIAFLLFVAYEMFEALVKIEETPMNRTLDVVVGMLSFTPTIFFAPLFGTTAIIGSLVVVGVLDAVLSFLGWRASQKAAVLEQKLRAEIQMGRQRFLDSRIRIRDKWRERRRMRRSRIAQKRHEGLLG